MATVTRISALLDRSAFRATRRAAYLDTATVGPLSRTTVAAVAGALQDVAEHGSAHLDEHFAVVERSRAQAADLLGATAESYAFVRSTTAGLAQVVQGLDLEPSDSIAVPFGEFPSLAASVLGTQAGLVWVNPGAVHATTLDDYRQVVRDPRVRLVVAPWVDASYEAVDLRALADLCHDAGALLCVDLIRGAGVLPLDLEAADVDFAVTNAYKWLLAGPGLGLLYVHPRHLDRLRSLEPGWLSTVWTGDGELAWRSDVRKLEGGTPAIPLHHGLAAALDELAELGTERIGAHVRTLSGELAGRLADAGLPAPRATEREGYAAAAVCRIPVRDPGGTVRALADRGVVCGASGSSLLVALHAFSDSDDLDQLVTHLGEHLTRTRENGATP